MNRVSLCLVALFVCAACEFETTIQVQGTVATADDGSPIAGASVRVSEVPFGGPITKRTQVQTNNQGDYSLSFIEMGLGGCVERDFFITASAQGFQSVQFSGLLKGPGGTFIRCTDELPCGTNSRLVGCGEPRYWPNCPSSQACCGMLIGVSGPPRESTCRC